MTSIEGVLREEIRCLKEEVSRQKEEANRQKEEATRQKRGEQSPESEVRRVPRHASNFGDWLYLSSDPSLLFSNQPPLSGN